jgi:hypothetical protein
MTTPRGSERQPGDVGEHRDGPDDGSPSDLQSGGVPPGEERVPITPTLVILGIVAVALGVFSALVMSAQSLSR